MSVDVMGAFEMTNDGNKKNILKQNSCLFLCPSSRHHSSSCSDCLVTCCTLCHHSYPSTLRWGVLSPASPVLAVQLFKSMLLCKHKRFVPAQLSKRQGVILWLSTCISINVSWKHHLHGEICAVFCRLLSPRLSWGLGSLQCHILMSTNKTNSRVMHFKL